MGCARTSGIQRRVRPQWTFLCWDELLSGDFSGVRDIGRVSGIPCGEQNPKPGERTELGHADRSGARQAQPLRRLFRRQTEDKTE